MNFVDCSYEIHGQAILDIFNEAIVNSTALYDYNPRTMVNMQQWFIDKIAGAYPIIGVEDGSELLGFATYGVFRARPAYKYSIEHSLYVHKDQSWQRLGVFLLERVIAAATTQNYHVMIGGIDADNQTSIALHRRFNFVHAGTIHQAGFKFGRWLDLAFYQLTLPTPTQPEEG